MLPATIQPLNHQVVNIREDDDFVELAEQDDDNHRHDDLHPVSLKSHSLRVCECVPVF